MATIALALAGGATAVSAQSGLAPVASVSAQAPAIVLNGNGLTVGGNAARFERTTRAEALAMVSAALGKPIKQGSHGDCGQGDVIGYARFRGAFELSFVKGRLSGWTADAPMPRTSRGIGVGATIAALRKAYPDVDLDPGDEKNGGPGASFQREGGPNGWIETVRPSAHVTGLFAGATCLPGI